MKITRKDIADAASVSVSTVGMILSGQGDRYSEATREKVHATAKNLGYEPSINARALRLNRSLLLGVLLCDANTHLAARFLQGVQTAIAHSDYSPLVFFTKGQDDQSLCLKNCMSRHVDAMIVNCTVSPISGVSRAFQQTVAGLTIPIVEVYGDFIPAVPKVNTDNVHASRRVAEQLIELGHRRIALLTHARYREMSLYFDAWEQATGYTEALNSADLKPRIVTTDPSSHENPATSFIDAGHQALGEMVDDDDPPTAIICYNDFIAYGANRASKDRGIRIPNELSIVGRGGTEISDIADPPLTTTRPRHFEIGQTAASMLLKAIDGAAIKNSLVAPDLVEGHSTTTAPGGI